MQYVCGTNRSCNGCFDWFGCQYLLGVDIHQSAMEAFQHLFDATSYILKGNSYICVNYPICQVARRLFQNHFCQLYHFIVSFVMFFIQRYSVGCTHYSVGCKHLLCRLYALLCRLYALLCQLYALLCRLCTILCQFYALLCQLYALLCRL